MKIVLFGLLLIYCSCSVGLSITFPEPKLVKSEEAWKFGIKKSTKVVEGFTYVSITIDSRLMCEVKDVESIAWKDNYLGDKLNVLQAVGAYSVKFSANSYSKIQFDISCKKESKVHRGYLFKYIAWSRENA